MYTVKSNLFIYVQTFSDLGEILKKLYIKSEGFRGLQFKLVIMLFWALQKNAKHKIYDLRKAVIKMSLLARSVW